jgi:hypothetical protein
LPLGWTVTNPLVGSELNVQSAVTLDVGLYRPRATASSAGFDRDNRHIRVTLSTDANRFAGDLAAAVRIRNVATGVVYPAQVAWDHSDPQPIISHRNVFRLGSSQSPLVLPDGNYVVEVDGSLLAASDDLKQPPGTTIPFYVLRGDLDGNRSVDFSDLLILAQNYGKLGLTFSQGNVNYDSYGRVNFDDLLIFAQQYRKSLAPALTIASNVAGQAKKRAITDLNL